MKFTEKDFKEFKDVKNAMREVFGITCSLCGLEEIAYCSINTPTTIGEISEKILEENPDINDIELEELLDSHISNWQEIDDLNFEKGIPTFLCETCYYQLINDEINVSQ